MGKKLGLVVVAALLLTGCASGEPEAAPTVTVTAAPEVTAVAGPIEVSAATPEAEPSEAVDEEARYLRGIKAAWRTEVPADDQLLSAAALACEQLRAGIEVAELNLVTGGAPEDNAWHTSQVAMLAGSTVCPDVLPGL